MVQARDRRPLTAEEIQVLESQGCCSDDWSRVSVAVEFDASRCVDVAFAGTVNIGRNDGRVEMSDGVPRDAGIYHARLRDTAVGDNCAVSNVHGWLSGLDVGDEAVIENVGTVACTGPSAFGNGAEICPLNEGGGRELRITARTSAQTAYLSVMYRDRPELVAALDAMSDRLCDELRSGRASIGCGARITNCSEIINVRIGESAVVSGAGSLRDGTIDSSAAAPTTVGQGVIAETFVFQKGSSVTDGAVVSTSLVGEGTRIGKQFSAENSLFFANSEGFHSEVCSVFGGPYTVTHHRSTLLIAAYLSFYNAGSGTNQSNHMYKLGPVHQGIMERGCKTGSFSYLLWPSRVGAFSVVMGKHYANFDTSDFPFSYIDEEGGKSVLVPGMNFFTVGTLRDGAKWPSRDRRQNEDKLDLIVFDVLSPYTAEKMIRGRAILLDLHAKTDRGHEYVTWNGIRIKRLLLRTCGRYYSLALDKYLGDILMGRMALQESGGIRSLLAPDAEGEDGGRDWVDACGLLCTKSRMDRLAAAVVSGEISTFDALHGKLREIHGAYKADEWNWFLSAYRSLRDKDPSEETAEGLRGFLEDWRRASLKLLNMVAGDAQKEFEGAVRTGFGIDGNADPDFEAVRGTFDGNKFVKQLKEEMGRIEQRFERACARID